MSRTTQLILTLMPFAMAALALALGQDANWDLKNYHWYNGYALLHGRFATDLLPSQTPFFYNPIFDAAFYAMATAVPSWLATGLLAALQGLNGWLIFALMRAVLPLHPRRDAIALGAAILALLGGGTLAELGTVFWDNILSLFIFGGLLIAMRALPRQFRQAWPQFLLAGALLGLATGAKLPTATFCVGLCGALLMTSGSPKQRFARAFVCGVGMLLGFAVSYGYWGAFLWHDFHNPLFPYFNNLFHSPITQATDARDVTFVPHGWLRTLLFPFAWTRAPLLVGEVPFRDLKLPLLLILLPLSGVLALRHRHRLTLPNPAATLLLATLSIAYVAWLLVFAIYRYAVPLEMLAAPALALIIVRLVPNARAQTIALASAALLCLATLQPADWGRTHSGDKFVSVDWPPLLTDSNATQTMVVMTGFQPYSHVIPELPAAMPVLRLQSNFSSPGEDKGINVILQQRVAAWAGGFLLLAPVYDAPWTAEKVLPQFGLTAQLDKCQPVHPNFGEELSLCPATKTR